MEYMFKKFGRLVHFGFVDVSCRLLTSSSLHLLRQTAGKGVEVVVGVSHELPAAQVQVGADGDGEEEPEREPKARDQNRGERQYQHHVHFDFDFVKFDSQNSGYNFNNCSFIINVPNLRTLRDRRDQKRSQLNVLISSVVFDSNVPNFNSNRRQIRKFQTKTYTASHF